MKVGKFIDLQIINQNFSLKWFLGGVENNDGVLSILILKLLNALFFINIVILKRIINLIKIYKIKTNYNDES